MVIIHKNRKFIQLTLLFRCIWCIVFVLYKYRVSLRSFIDFSYFYEANGEDLLGGNCLLHVSKSYYFFPKIHFIYVIFLALFWILGTTTGICLSRITFLNCFPLMLTFDLYGVSIVSVFLVKIFPLFITIFISLYISDPLISAFAFARAVLFGFCIGIIYCMYRSSGWLVQLLLLFSGPLVNVVLLCYWISILLFNQRSLNSAIRCASILFLVLFVELCFVMPFVNTLAL